MIKAIVLDLDGTLYRGGRVIPGIPRTLETLRKNGFKLFFVSNASMRTREDQARKLRKMDIACTINEMYNSAYATANYVKANYLDPCAYVISEGGLRTELKRAGVKIIKRENEDPTVVVTGLDTKLTFEKLTIALRALLNGADFIVSNADRIYPVESGILPGSGTIAAFLQYGSRKKPIIIGKPSTHLIEAVLKENKLKRDEVLIVGDNYETDILVAHALRIKSALVLTGLTKRSDLKKWKKKPDYVIRSVKDLPQLIRSTRQ